MSFGRNVLAQVVVALLGSVAVGGAQSAQSCPPATGEPYLRCQVDRVALSDTNNVAPRYADMLRQARAFGSARLSFIVNANGRVEPASITVLEARYDLFAASARNALKTWTFVPAQKAGAAVAMRFEQDFEFRLSADSEVPPLEVVVLARDTTPDGVLRIVVGERDREPNAAARYSEGDLLAAQRAVLLTVAPMPVADPKGRPRVTACVTIILAGAKQPADSTTLDAVSAPGRRAVVPKNCPRTYASMIYDPDRRPPKGWIDPSAMVVDRVYPWNDDIVAVAVLVSQGTVTDHHLCSASRSRGWRVTCGRIRAQIS